MVDQDGRVRVADFGLAKSLHASAGLTRSDISMGTPDYVAPESLTLGMTADHRADLYAVGVMLYQMLTSKIPRGHFRLPSELIPGLDPRFDEIALKAMAEDREHRFQSAREIRAALDEILSVPLSSQAPAKPASPNEPKSLLPPILAGSVTALGVGGVAVLFLLGGKSGETGKHASPAIPEIQAVASAPVQPTASPGRPAAQKPSPSPSLSPAAAGTRVLAPAPVLPQPAASTPEARPNSPKPAVTVADQKGGDLQTRNTATPANLEPPPALLAMMAHGGMLREWNPGARSPLDFSEAKAYDDFVGIILADGGAGSWTGRRANGGFTGRGLSQAVLGKRIPLRDPADVQKLREGLAAVPEGQIKQVAMAEGWGVILTREGTLVPFGPAPLKNAVKAPGWDEAQTALRALCGVREVAVAAHSCLVLFEDGTVACWHVSSEQPKVTAPSEASQVVRIACGNANFLAQSRDGRVRNWDVMGAMIPVPPWDGPAVAFQMQTGSHQISAAQLANGRWVAWTTYAHLQAVVNQINELGPAIDLAFVGGSTERDNRVVWIEPAPSAHAVTVTGEPKGNSLGMRFVPVPITGGPTNGKQLLFSVWETRVMDYEAFVKATSREWTSPDYANRGLDHPAGNINWHHAVAFCVWLTAEERKTGWIGPKDVYRLPSDHEWSCAVGIGDREDAETPPPVKQAKVKAYPWGPAFPPPAGAGNYLGEENPANSNVAKAPLSGYRDEVTGPASVGRFAANSFGLYDLSGNAWEWCQDVTPPDHRVVRGASWLDSGAEILLASCRAFPEASRRDGNRGFRCVLELDPAAPAEALSATLPTGQWVKLFTKPDDLPPSQRTPTQGTTWDNGWIVAPKGFAWRPVLATDPVYFAPFRNGGIRMTASPGAPFELRVRGSQDGRVMCYAMGPEQVYRAMDPNKEHQSNRLAMLSAPPKPGENVVWEFGVVGNRIIARASGRLMAAVLDDKIVSAGWPGIVNAKGRFRDFEVINLDGLPEPEALQMLGVDEQGNDLIARATEEDRRTQEQAKKAATIAAIPELKALQEQFLKLEAERVTAPFEADLAKLNTGYLGGLDRAIADQKKAGNLEGVLLLEEEKRQLAAGQSLPEDAEGTPDYLKKLRAIYRTSQAKLEATRAANLKTLTDPLTVRLKRLESTLTQQNRIEHAKVVKAYREALGGPAAADPLGAPRPSSPPAARAKPDPAARNHDPRISREVAEFVLAKGGIVKCDGSDAAISRGNPLPRSGKISSILFSGEAIAQLTDSDLANMTRAAEVTSFSVESGGKPVSCPLTLLAPLRGWPGLEEFHYWPNRPGPLQAQELLVLRELSTLRKVVIGHVPLDRDAVDAIVSLPALEELTLSVFLARTDVLAPLGKATGLRQLQINGVQDLTDSTLRHLAPLARLETLVFQGTTGTLSGAGLAQLHPQLGQSLTRLVLETSQQDRGNSLLDVLPGRFGKLQVFQFYGPVSAESLKRLTELPDLTELILRVPDLDGTHLSALAGCRPLERLSLSYCKLDPACFASLRDMRQLQSLSLGLDQYGNRHPDSPDNAKKVLKLDDRHLDALAELRQIGRIHAPAGSFNQAAIEQFWMRRRDCELVLVK